MAAAGGASVHFVSVIRGHHIYKAVWTPIVGETVQVCKEPSNPFDVHAVAILKDGSTVGHVPRLGECSLASWMLEEKFHEK